MKKNNQNQLGDISFGSRSGKKTQQLSNAKMDAMQMEKRKWDGTRQENKQTTYTKYNIQITKM